MVDVPGHKLAVFGHIWQEPILQGMYAAYERRVDLLYHDEDEFEFNKDSFPVLG